MTIQEADAFLREYTDDFGNVYGGKHFETHEDTEQGSFKYVRVQHLGYQRNLCVRCGTTFLTGGGVTAVTCGRPECGMVMA